MTSPSLRDIFEQRESNVRSYYRSFRECSRWPRAPFPTIPMGADTMKQAIVEYSAKNIYILPGE